MPGIHIVIVVLCGMLFLGFVLRQIYQEKVRIFQALSWVVIGLAILVSPLLYPLLDWAHAALNWPTATSLLFLLGMVLIFLLLFQMSVTLTRLWRDRTQLARKISELEDQLRNLEHQLNSAQAPNHHE